MSDLVKLIERIGEDFEGFRARESARIDALQDRVEQQEALADRPRASDDGSTRSGLTAGQREHTKTFIEWVRKPSDAVRVNRLTENEHELGKKDVTIGTGAAGGFALPEEISRAIETRERQLNPFRRLVNVQQTSTNDWKELVSMADGTTGWVGETGSRTGTAAPTLRERAPTFGEQYAYPTASEWSLDDVFFNVQQWLVNEVAADWASQEATAIISGNGTNRPTGILNTTPTTTSDDASPVRAAGVIQYVSLTGPSSPVTINIDSLIVLVHTLKERYLMESDGVAFVMHRLTASLLRRLKASTAGSYLWSDNLQAGQPPMLLGYPVYTCDAMPTVANDNFAVLFGNFRRGYSLVDRVGMRITPNPYSVPGMVSFYCRRRVGGAIRNNDALKALRIAD